MTQETAPSESRSLNFIEEIMQADLADQKHGGRICTRFPPEPNGYLHIGHAKSICINFGLARKNGGSTNLRFDDTNPSKEEVEYVDSIREDVRWLGFEWAGEHYASDYFQFLYDYAEYLIQEGKAYVCDLSDEEIRDYRGNFFKAGRNSPYRDRSPEENLELFRAMRSGAFEDGVRVLRARIDMQSPNMNMRDPLMYRIRRVHHHRTGHAWPIYPMYDYAHGVSDAIERITHSICTLEFEDHRPLYDWFLEQDVDGRFFRRPLPRQIEFARLNLTYTVMSKRKLMQLVQDRLVTGWDDPRMPTISGLRRRGVTARALRDFAYNIGITKYDGMTEVGVLDHAIRDDLNRHALRRLAVLRPVKVVFSNLPEDYFEELEAYNLPDDPTNTRKIPFTREVFIEAEDFMEIPPPKYFRLRPGGEVRLKYGYIIKCDEVIKDNTGNIAELRCTVDLTTKRGGPNADRKVKGTIHWVSATRAVDAEVRLYDRLFTVPEPDAEGDFKAHLNPHSLEVLAAKCEPSLADASPEERYQFERLAYFALDKDSAPGKLVFNRTITLKDTWAKEAKK